MAENYQKINEQLKNIKRVDSVSLSWLVSQIPINSNCLISGGIELESVGGSRVYNRKVILSSLIQRLIEYYPGSVIVFYKSTYIKQAMRSWLNQYSGKKKIVFLDGETHSFEPFKQMNKEEIIYTIKNLSDYIGISIDQYSQMYLDYILKLLEFSGYEIKYDNIMTLIERTNEELSLIARRLNLEVEAKYFSKTNNGSESIKRVFREFNNFIKDYYSDKCVNKTNICSEVRNGNVIFIYVDDQYQSELLEYFTNELKSISKCNPYIIFDDIMIKNNKNLEDLLIKTVGMRFCLANIDIGGMVTSDNYDNFRALVPTKLMLHYDDLNAAEKLSTSVGHYYYLKTSQEKSKNKEAFQISPFDTRISDGISVTEEKREIIEGTDLMNLNEHQLYFIDKSIEKYFINNVIYKK